VSSFLSQLLLEQRRISEAIHGAKSDCLKTLPNLRDQCSEADVLTKNHMPTVRSLREENCEKNNVINVRRGKGDGSSY
jgi:hypothetical protein